MYAIPVTDIEITSVLPTGWKGTIKTVSLTGKRVKELAEQGYDKDGFVYPYELVTKEGLEIEDVQHCIGAGMDAYIAKPLDIAVLEKNLRGFVNGGQIARRSK